MPRIAEKNRLFPLQRRLTRFTVDLSFRARREFRSLGSIVLYRRVGEQRDLLEIDWEQVAVRRRWSGINSLVERAQRAGPAPIPEIDLRPPTDTDEPVRFEPSEDIGPPAERRPRA